MGSVLRSQGVTPGRPTATNNDAVSCCELAGGWCGAARRETGHCIGSEAELAYQAQEQEEEMTDWQHLGLVDSAAVVVLVERLCQGHVHGSFLKPITPFGGSNDD